MQVGRWIAVAVVAACCGAVPVVAVGVTNVGATKAGDAHPLRRAASTPTPTVSARRDSSRFNPSPTPAPTPKPTRSPPPPATKAATPPAAPAAGHLDPVALVRGSGATVDVADDTALTHALAAARPGDTVRLAAGRYAPITITSTGTAAAPITLRGPADAVVEGGSGYTVHLHGASHWQLTGFTVTGGSKAIMTDDTNHVVLDSLTVGDTDEEAVHFRGSSSDNVIQNSRIHDTGDRNPEFGEGVYVGSAKSNWKKYSGGGPDLSMHNHVIDNVFADITAENVDIKEETGGTVVSGNRFDGSAISGKNSADSVVDLKGFASTIVDNVTTGNSPNLGNIIETHVITDPATSGCGNTIEGNTTKGFRPSGQMVAVDEKCS